MRTACLLEAGLPRALSAGTSIVFVDGSYPERIGWREVVVEGDGTTVVSDLPATSASARLTAYPTDLLSRPPDVRRAELTASPGGPSLPELQVPEASPISGSDPVAGGPGGVGGLGAEISGLLSPTDVTPLVLVVSLLTALALGAGHALTPGHGKTIMAAYLVGTRGTPLHAIGLGLTVTVSHTLGIALLAALVLAAGASLPPERFQVVAPVVSALIVTAIGVWMVAGHVRRRWHGRVRVPALVPAPALASVGIGHEGGHGPAHPHPHGHPHPRHEHETDHRHGPFGHRHLPAEPSAVSTKALLALGLAGGLVPSTNALLILLATVATGQAAYGLVLVVAFGVGMAIVLAGIGLALVLARDRVERIGAGSPRLDAIVAAAPVGASVLVLGIGMVLTIQSLGGALL
jgi:ABC-type nickel/cobalt efflux system permease component RcnA